MLTNLTTRRNGHLRHMNSSYQGEIDMLNRIIIKNEIEYVIITFTTSKSPGCDGFRSKLYQTHKKKVRPNLLKFLKKCKNKEHSQRHSMMPPVTLIPKPDKDTTKKENYRPISLMNIDAKILNKILAY